MLAYVFPGQGAQFKGMGRDLFDEFSELIKKADHILGYSIKDLCLSDEKRGSLIRSIHNLQFIQ